MKVFITGGTGFVGRALAAGLSAEGHTVSVLTRSVPRENRLPNVAYIGGNPTEEGEWQGEVANHDVVINLAGSSIFTRWTEEAKQEIRDSRILATRNIVAGLPANKENGGLTLLNGSAIGFYGFHGDEVLAEESAVGTDFLARLAQEWEGEAGRAEEKGCRVVLCRFGVVLGQGGGALGKMLPVFKMGFGSPLGSGKQWFSWIHIQDLVNILLYVMEHNEISGPINCTAPNPVTNRELTTVLGKKLGRPTFLPAVPSFFSKVLGEFGSIFFKGQRVLPGKLLAGNFIFRYPTIEEALADLV